MLTAEVQLFIVYASASSKLLFTASKLDIIQGSVIHPALWFLHLGHNATDSVRTLTTPAPPVTPGHATTKQKLSIGAAELDVVGSGVISPSLWTFHTEAEGLKIFRATILVRGPTPPSLKYTKHYFIKLYLIIR